MGADRHARRHDPVAGPDPGEGRGQRGRPWRVAVGSTAKVRLVNGTEMEGTVRLVAREASAETRTFPVEIALPNPD